MAPNDYHFITHWRVRARIEEVADVLRDPLQLPRWWPAVYLEVHQVEPGDSEGTGRTVALTTKGWLPYTLRWQFRIVESRYPYLFRVEALGAFNGTGVWRLRQDGEFTDAVYDWRIHADKALLRRFSSVLKPLFRANHHWAMRKGELSLELELRRRRARSAKELNLVPAPPGPTFVKTASRRFPPAI